MKSFSIIISSIIIFVLFSWSSNSDQLKHEETSEMHHEEESDVVSITSDQMKTAGIMLSIIEQKNIGSSIKVNGKLEVPAQNKALVTSLYGGLVRELMVHPGSSVRKGQVMAVIANTELAGLQQNYISVHAQLKLAQLEYNRQQSLVAGNAAPLKNLQKAQAELTSLQAQQSALRRQLTTLGINSSSVSSGNISSTLTVVAPISGTVSDIHAQIGSRVDEATPIAEIVNNAELHLDLFVYERDLPSIKEGQTIHFTLTNNPGKEYDAKIFSIGTAFANDSKSVPVHAEVQGEKGGLIEGMNVTAIISIGNRTAPAIPTEAIVSNEGKDYILIETKDKEKQHTGGKDKDHVEDDKGTLHFERIQVVKGASDLGYTEIQPVTELPSDVRIIVKGAFFVMAKMTNSAGHEH